MRVYRLEGANGESIYRDWMPEPRANKTLWTAACGSDNGSDNHPVPHNDQPFHRALIHSPYMVYDLHFGFLTRDQYLAWVFNPVWRQNLTDLGVVLRVYEVPLKYLFIGTHQVGFVKDKAEVVAEHAPIVYDYCEAIDEVA